MNPTQFALLQPIEGTGNLAHMLTCCFFRVLQTRWLILRLTLPVAYDWCLARWPAGVLKHCWWSPGCGRDLKCPMTRLVSVLLLGTLSWVVFAACPTCLASMSLRQPLQTCTCHGTFALKWLWGSTCKVHFPTHDEINQGNIEGAKLIGWIGGMADVFCNTKQRLMGSCSPACRYDLMVPVKQQQAEFH